MHRTACLLGAIVAIVAGGCMPAPPKPPPTQLEVRQYQTRTFDTPDWRMVMKAMLNVLQDDGYVVTNAVVDLGLITAQRETDLAPGRSGDGTNAGVIGGLGSIILGGSVGVGTQTNPPRYSKTERRDFTGNVTEFGQQTKVRVSFQRKVLDNRGDVIEVEPIEDPEIYQDFFWRMDKSLFLQKERL